MGNSSPTEHQKQAMTSQQSQIVDQNYSNNIMFIAFSTLETICLKILGKDLKSTKKMFSYYDKVDYTSKTIPELMQQLQVHLTLIKVSKMEMQKNFQDGFIFPQEFPKERALQQLNDFQRICQNSNHIAFKFCKDFKSILNKEYKDLSFEYQRIDAKESPINPKEFIQRGFWAGNEMDKLKEQTISSGVSNAQKLPANISPSQYNCNK